MSVELERAAHIPLPPSVHSLHISDIEESSTQEEYELQTRDSSVFSTSASNENLPQRNVSSLAPTDGGFRAWSFVGELYESQLTSKMITLLSYEASGSFHSRGCRVGLPNVLRCTAQCIPTREQSYGTSKCFGDSPSHRSYIVRYYVLLR